MAEYGKWVRFEYLFHSYLHGNGYQGSLVLVVSRVKNGHFYDYRCAGVELLAQRNTLSEWRPILAAPVTKHVILICLSN